MNHVLIAAMAEAGETADSLAGQVGVDPKTAARWANPGRIPRARHRAEVAGLLGREVAELWPDVLTRREPAWFRPWADIERQAVSLRSFQLAWVPGLLQTEAYARATLAGEAMTSAEVEDLAAARVSRQAVLRRERPPLFIAVFDEMVLRRTAGDDRAMMAEQLAALAGYATMPAVRVYIVPLSAGMYPGLGGPFTLAELPDGGRVAHIDSQAPAQITEQTVELATLERRWECVRGEALSRTQSLDLIREAATSWT
ncbi:hypothetical protein DKT68_22975 [Micromonospora acroterricola]|uniref:DUF5753 domain-containing protein n=1 Tax=Micromonospora acroterricola TaxID=2202421 RepID=A0A317D130_9ACTN|nr:DUF5753 domain-containing protein [Micromonospora acroterricola]PWR06285.1 hypothetical protein DKT68_22975 [Micromonospora acroterricola]